MSIATELQNYADGLGDSYDAVNDMGGIIPAQRNMDNLDQAIRTIPQNQGTTYTAGTGIDITNDVISVDTTVIAEKTDIPTATSDLTNDSGFITSADLPTKTSDLTNDGSDGSSTYVEADDLAAVATSGSYNDLADKPTIPETMTVYVGASFASPSSIISVYSDSALSEPADPEDMADVISAGGTVVVVYDGGQAQEYIELSSVNSNSRFPEVGHTFTSTISTSAVFSAPTVVTLLFDDYYGTWSVKTTAVTAVNDATLTIQHNGTNVQTFTANQSTNATANIETIWADDIEATTPVPAVETAMIADGAVTPAKLSDTGWVNANSYINTTYFAPRANIYYRILGGVVYWSGEVYCHTAPGNDQQSILVNLPLSLRAFQQVNIYGSQYMVSNSDYSIWTELDYFVLREINQNIPATSGYQGYNLGQMRYISSEY